MNAPDRNAALLTLQFKGAINPVLFHNAPQVAAHVQKVLALWPRTQTDPDRQPITISGNDGWYVLHSPWQAEPLDGLSDVGGACGAIVDSAQSFLAANPDYLCLHCTSFEIGGQLVVLTGSAHAGKSTLAARMAAENVLVYCDDMLPLTAPDNLGLAMGIPPRPRLPLPDGAGETIARHIETHTAATDGKYCYLDTTHLAPHGRTAPIGIVLLLDRRKDGPAGFAPAERGEALRHLLLRNMIRNSPASALTERLDAVLEAVPCLKLFYAKLDDAARLLTDTFGAWPVDPGDLLSDQPDPGAPLQPTGDRAYSASALDTVEVDRLYRRAPGIVARRAGRETFLFDADDVSVFNLNELAAAIWALLEEPISPAETADCLCEAFPGVERDIVLRDTRSLFADLRAVGVIEPV